VIGALMEGRVVHDLAVRLLDVAVYLVPGAAVADGDRGEIAEHVLADRVEGGVGDVVRLLAVDVAHGIGGLAVQVLDADVLLLAGLVVGACRELHVDRGARDHVLVVARGEREVLTDPLLHQHRGAVDGDVAAVVVVPHDVGPILGQHATERRSGDHHQRQQRPPERTQQPPASRALGARVV